MRVLLSLYSVDLSCFMVVKCNTEFLFQSNPMRTKQAYPELPNSVQSYPSNSVQYTIRILRELESYYIININSSR
jgi:hypothetical protein